MCAVYAKKNAPVISVIVPVYNVETFLHKCIDSILEQTFVDFELIIIDDGSSDSSVIISKSYVQKDERVRLICSENGGVSIARNIGLREAKGQYVTFVDSDDFLENRALEILHSEMLKGQYDLTCASYNRLYISGERVPYIWPSRILHSPYDLAYVSYETNMTLLGVVWGKLYRRDIINRYNINFPEKITLSEDNIFNILYYSHVNNARLLSDTIYNYRQTPNSLCTKITYKRAKDQILAFKCREEYFEKFVKIFDKQNFASRMLPVIGMLLRSAMCNEKSVFKQIQFIKSSLMMEFVSNCIRLGESLPGMSLIDKIYVHILKCNSIIFIFLAFYLINMFSTVRKAIKNAIPLK
ncbi:glycosyltransferase [uncultured Cloacibacillus sp.]|uniref:glycosyltransferase family 2 protein n=1 Tax=uncultured Cloacibacillus sp. TaxID=889794 RepID=UPI00262994B2|nr:glycosyltransferase [uncultured Cloacibacillus sp.]